MYIVGIHTVISLIIPYSRSTVEESHQHMTVFVFFFLIYFFLLLFPSYQVLFLSGSQNTNKSMYN